nr:MAG: MotA/TolQ/ExbB proton channel family protein [Hyphomicrobiales bacterium]
MEQNRMNAKTLTIASAVVALMLGFGQAVAQDAEGAAPAAAADPFAAPATDPFAAPDPFAAGADAAPAVPVGGPGAIEEPTEEIENPYGIVHMWNEGDMVAHTVLIILVIMSGGSWYIFFVKYWEQYRVLSQSKLTEKRFWTAASLDEGIEQLAKNNVFRNVAERGQQAMAREGGMLTQADWVSMSLGRAVEEESARLEGGISFIASVASTAPFVGLFGTVWGILNALTAIGIAGQASIDRVAGPVGEALIMTAIGLAVAVPAVITYNLLVRRNKVINEKYRSFASDLQTFLLSSKR